MLHTENQLPNSSGTAIQVSAAVGLELHHPVKLITKPIFGDPHQSVYTEIRHPDKIKMLKKELAQIITQKINKFGD